VNYGALAQMEILHKSFDKTVFYKAKSLCKKVWMRLCRASAPKLLFHLGFIRRAQDIAPARGE